MLFVIFVNFFTSVWQVQTVLLLSLAQANASMCDLNSLSVASNLSDFLAALHTYAGKGEDEEPFLLHPFCRDWLHLPIKASGKSSSALCTPVAFVVVLGCIWTQLLS